MSKKIKENFDCPHCGQDFRLSPDAKDEIETAYDDGFAAAQKETASLRAENERLKGWQNAALRIGEGLASVGPDGYYAMTADQWLNWAMQAQIFQHQSWQKALSQQEGKK